MHPIWRGIRDPGNFGSASFALVILAPDELGWKDTVRVDPFTVTRIIVRFEGYAGRYVWHCHMLEH